jgi:imidazolonepropionase-like amidohydrolase
MATCVRGGVDRRTALEALTVVPARMLGLEDQLGSIAEGKLANLQILTGDPLQATTWVDSVLLDGQVVYTRKDDPRLKYLLQAPAQKTEAEPKPKDEGK